MYKTGASFIYPQIHMAGYVSIFTYAVCMFTPVDIELQSLVYFRVQTPTSGGRLRKAYFLYSLYTIKTVRYTATRYGI